MSKYNIFLFGGCMCGILITLAVVLIKPQWFVKQEVVEKECVCEEIEWTTDSGRASVKFNSN